MVLLSNLLLIVGLVTVVIAATLVTPAAGFATCGAGCIWLSYRLAA